MFKVTPCFLPDDGSVNYGKPIDETVGTENFSADYTFKYFGESPLLKRGLKEAEEISDGKLSYSVSALNGDSTIKLFFDKSADNSLKSECVRKFFGLVKDYVYAEFETTLTERVFDLLKLKNKKISVSESFTGGRVVSELIKNAGVSAYLHEGIVSYSNLSKEERLSVKKEDIESHGAVSPEVAYAMAAGLLYTGYCDVAVSTTGIAGPGSDNTLKPVGLCYIGVGTREGIDVYKYVFSGNREEITEKGKNAALFRTIKKLKTL